LTTAPAPSAKEATIPARRLRLISKLRPCASTLLALLLCATTLCAAPGQACAAQATLPPELDAAPAAPPSPSEKAGKPEAPRQKSPAPREKAQRQPARFTQDALGVVTDAQTGLQWFVGPDKDMSWNQACSWAVSLKVGGGRWRMPTRAELRGLSGGGESEGLKIHPIFRLKHTFVWTGEERDAVKVWLFSFGLGKEFADNRGLSNDARAFAVRVR